MKLDFSNDYAPQSRALMRLKRENLEQLAADCERLEKGENMSDTFLGIAGAVASVAGNLVMPGLGMIMGGAMLGFSAAKGVLGDARIKRECADVPIKQLEQRLDKKFHEVNRRLDRQEEILKGVSEKVSETLSKLETIRQEMKAGFEQVLQSITAQDIKNIISDIENARLSVTDSEDSKREAGKEKYVNNIEQEIEHNFLFNYVNRQGSLYNALFSIINKKYAEPKNIEDKNAYNALDAMHFGTLTYASIVLSLIDQYAYLSEYYYQMNELDKFNDLLDKLVFYFNDFKYILLRTNGSGLIGKTISLLDSAKNSHNMQNKKDSYKALESQISTLRELKQKINEIKLPVLDEVPNNDVEISFNSYEGIKSSTTDFLEWKKGTKVSYALQFESGGKYSKISRWLPPQEVMSIANPDIELRNFNQFNRLVFRKFDNNPPQLVRIVSGTQRSFRDVDRDLYNLASVDSYSDQEISSKMDKLLGMGADVHSVFESKRNIIHAAAEAGRVEMLKKILDLGYYPPMFNLKDSIGYTPLHIAVERKKVNVVKELIGRKADVNAQSDSYGWTPLHLAVRYQSKDILKLLLASPDIQPNGQDKAGMTPLHVSVSDETFSSDIVLDLLTAPKVGSHAYDNIGLTPLHYATMLGVADFITPFKTIKADMYPGDEHGLTPLHYAAIKGHTRLNSLLLPKHDMGHINDLAGDRKWTPLHYSVFFKQTEFSTDFIPIVTNLDTTDIDNQTALHLAAASGQKDVVSKLLEFGAKVYLKTVHQHTALDLAIIHGRKEVIDDLLRVEKKQETESRVSAKDEDTLACGLAKGEILDLLIRKERCNGKYRRYNKEDFNDFAITKSNSSIGSISPTALEANTIADNGKNIMEINSDHDSINNEAFKVFKPKETLERKNSISFKHTDVNGALLLLDLLIRKLTKEKHKSEWLGSDAELDAKARALNITQSLGKFVAPFEDRNSANHLDLFEAHSKIYKALLSGSKNKLANTLCSYLKDYPVLQEESVDKFVAYVLQNNPITGFPETISGKFQILNSYTCY